MQGDGCEFESRRFHVPYKDKDQQREYNRRWVADRRSTFFADKHCAICLSVTNLELDHVDPTTKVDHRIWSWSEERRSKELEKCQVLCKTCHKRKSDEDQTLPHGDGVFGKRRCKCDPCVAKRRAANAEWMRNRRAAKIE